MIRYATKNDIPQLKALWRQAFADEESFIERFFEQRVLSTLKQAILLEEDGIVVSMLYALPCVLRHGVSNTEYKAVNLVGVATEEGHRNKGYMRRLLEAAFSMFREQGVEVVVLKPSNPQFYEKFGFHICNTLYQNTLSKEQFTPPEQPIAFLQEVTGRISGYHMVRSDADWQFMLDDGALVSRWQDGYAICEETEDGFITYEMIPIEKGIPCGYTMYKKIGQSSQLPEDIGFENAIFEWY